MNISKKTRSLTFFAVMLAVTIILDVTPLGAIPLGSVSATIVHVPTIITGIILGPVYGLLMGTSMGLVSLLHALMRPASALDPLFINPIISVLPRMMIGVVSYFAYKLAKALFGKSKIGDTISAAVGGVLGSMTNTVLVLSLLYIVYVQEIIERLGMADAAAVRTLIIGIITTNAIMEAIVAGVITTAVVVAYHTVFRNNLINED